MPATFDDLYAALSPTARLLAQAYGVAAPCPMGATRIYQVMAAAGVRVPGAKGLGRRISQADIRRSNSDLIAAGITVRETVVSGIPGVNAAPECALPLTRIAHAEGRLRPLLVAVQKHLPELRRTGLAEPMHLRAHLVAGDVAKIRRSHVYGPPSAAVWGFVADPFAADLLEPLPEPVRTHALEGCLAHVIETAAPPEPIMRACEGVVGEGRLLLAPDSAFIRVLQGRFDAAEAVFAALPRAVQGEKLATTALAAIRAFVAVLRGDDGEAGRRIEEALALERSGTRRRLVFPYSRAFALSLLGLVRAGTVQANELLEEILRAAEKSVAGSSREMEPVYVARAARAGSHRDPERGYRLPGIGTLWTGLAVSWHHRGGRAWPPGGQAMLRGYRDRAAENGFAWVVAECDDVLRRTAADGRAGADAGVSRHAAPGTVPLATVAEPVPEWQRRLEAIENVSRSVARQGNAASSAARRLVWILSHNRAWVAANPKEQRRAKGGGWTKGRNVALIRLAEEAESIDYLLPQDRKAAAAVAAYARQWYRWEPELPPEGIYALAGHPYVFDEDGHPVEVVRRDPELSIEPGEGGAVVVSLRPYPDQTGPGEAEFLFRMATATRCEVTRFTDSHMELLEAIPSDGVEIPPEAAPRLVEAVSALAPVMRVQSAAEGEAGTLPHVEADPVPRVRLVPFEDGLAVSLAVEPVAGSGIRFDAGAGGATVFATLDGQSVQARRDLDAERAALEALIERCPLLSPRPTERRPLRLPDPADCLELLEALEDSATPCEWPEGQPLRVVARAAASSLRLNVKSVGEWVRASGKLVVDETRVFDLKPLLELLDENPGTRFVPLESGQFLALTDTFRRQLDDLRSLSTPAARGAVRLHPAAALAVSGLIEGAELTADRGWRDLRASVAEAQSYQPEVPGTLRAELRPYQVDGYRWLARLARWGAGACLADDMGLGKTVQALALLLRRAPDGPALVVAPTSVLANWVTEAGRFAPTLNVTVYAGPAAPRARLLESSGPFDLVVTSYGLLQNDADQLTGVSWGTVVLDEAQAIKNAATKRARAARRLDAGFRVATTGTPIQNNLMELHSLFGFINPGLLGSATQFRRNFAVAIERGGEDDVRARLKRLIAPFILRRLKTEVLQDLPERTEITLHVKLSSGEVALYEALRQRTVAALETAAAGGEGARRIQVLAHLTRLRLACCHPRLVLDRVGADAPAETLRSSKLEAFAETLSELLENRHKVLVFSQFVMHMKLVEEYLKGAGISYQYLDGSTPRRARAERINAFQTGRGDVFLISLKAGGLGLNLTAADYVIHLDPWWNPAVEDQASDRAHRIGQTRPVTIYRLITEGTIEEQIVDLHHRKRNLADRLLEGADGAASLSADELLKLLEQPLGVRAVPSA